MRDNCEFYARSIINLLIFHHCFEGTDEITDANRPSQSIIELEHMITVADDLRSIGEDKVQQDDEQVKLS